KIASLGSYFINDSFGTLHNHDSSTTLVPSFFSLDKKSCGFLVQEELQTLSHIFLSSTTKSLIILGGAKSDTKVRYLQGLFDIAHTILLCPAFVFSFLHACKQPIGKSLADITHDALYRSLVDEAKKRKVRIIFPLDYLVAQN